MDRLQAMRAFVRVVELGSFTRAAAELRVKQSTVSKWVAALEEQLAAQLVQRTSRAHRVTEAGRLFYDRAREILGTWEDLELALGRATPGLRGRLKVSVPAVFGRLYVLPHVPRFAEAHPDLEIELSFDDRYVNLVDEGFDVLVRVGRPLDSSLKARTLAPTRRHVVASPAYLEARGRPDAPAELTAHDCLLHSSLSTTGIWTFKRAGKAARTSVTGRFAANHSEALLAMARAGQGVAMLASWLVAGDLARGTLVELFADYELPPAPVQALTAPSRYMHPRVRRFVDFLVDALADLRAGVHPVPTDMST